MFSSQNKSLLLLSVHSSPCVPKAASSVGQGGLPLQMAWFAALLSAVAPSLPARVRDDHLVGEGMQGVVHDLHLY